MSEYHIVPGRASPCTWVIERMADDGGEIEQLMVCDSWTEAAAFLLRLDIAKAEENPTEAPSPPSAPP
jgi:hypothetical protein